MVLLVLLGDENCMFGIYMYKFICWVKRENVCFCFNECFIEINKFFFVMELIFNFI